MEGTVDDVLLLISPELHAAGWDAITKMWSHPYTREMANAWSSPYTGITVISNRVTPSHVDAKGYLRWYDILLGFGTYTQATLRLPDIGAELEYLPGTIIAINGKFLRHEVTGWIGGDRICYAHFMRKEVLDRLGVRILSWVAQADYL